MKREDEMETICPACGHGEFREFARADAIRRETELRQRFVERRAARRLSESERKDLTDFAHDEIAPLLACSRCGVLLRAETNTRPVRKYVEDNYDFKVANRLFPRYAQAFRKKRDDYHGLLPADAEVLEIGSHMGAFLQVAEEWGWRALGLDVGRDTAEYARSKGGRVLERPIEEAELPAAAFDAVFIWNCFEQIPRPQTTLRQSRRVLKPGGALVIRTPNALFYKLIAHILGASVNESLPLCALAYNNLLGFPYLYGYDTRNLDGAVAPHGFECVQRINSELITVPLPDTPAWVCDEERAVSAQLTEISRNLSARYPQLLGGPWIELTYRKR